MSFWLRALFACQWLLSGSLLYAQVGFSLPVINNVSTGAILNPAVKVTGFDSIASAQYVICWDPQVLQFQGLSNFNLPGLDSTRFGFLKIAEGTLSFAWPSPDLIKGTSVANGTTIFRLRFKAIGTTGMGSGLKFMEKMPTAIEVVKISNSGSSVEVPRNRISFTHGYVAMGYTVANEEPESEQNSVEIFPNPFSESTQVVFHLPKSRQVRCAVTDASGRLVYEATSSFPAGRQQMTIKRSQLGAATGTYFLTLQMGETSVSKPIFLTD